MSEARVLSKERQMYVSGLGSRMGLGHFEQGSDAIA